MCNVTCKGCNVTNGICDKGCQPGWSGLFCQDGIFCEMHFNFFLMANQYFFFFCVQHTILLVDNYVIAVGSSTFFLFLILGTIFYRNYIWYGQIHVSAPLATTPSNFYQFLNCIILKFNLHKTLDRECVSLWFWYYCWIAVKLWHH